MSEEHITECEVADEAIVENIVEAIEEAIDYYNTNIASHFAEPFSPTAVRSDFGQQVHEVTLHTAVKPVPLPDGIMDDIPFSPPPFGHGLLSQVVFLRTYARIKSDGAPETWREVVERTISGLWSIFVWHMNSHHLPLDNASTLLGQINFPSTSRSAAGGSQWKSFLRAAAGGMYRLEWTPPGRGLWMMGTDFVYARGATALNNCAAVSTEKSLVSSACWTMDTLMNGGGVGFDTLWKPASVRDSDDIRRAELEQAPSGVSWKGISLHTIADSREGWVWSVKVLLNAYLREDPEVADEFENFPEFDYRQIRARGQPIKGFGGIASGPWPLITLHKRLKAFLDMYLPGSGIHGADWPQGIPGVYHTKKEFFRRIAEIDYPDDVEKNYERFVEADAKYDRPYDTVRLVTDIFNAIGDCVVSGNVRRSAEIAIGEPESSTFRHLKDFSVYPERSSIACMSNNSVRFTQTDQYTRYLPEIVEQIRSNGEPGLLFQLNISRYGRVSRPPIHAGVAEKGLQSREFEEDAACLSNPCGEICLESNEFCNLSEVTLTRFLRKRGFNGEGGVDEYSFDLEDFVNTLKFATFYCKCVSLLPCHSEVTNAVIARNRRIGVSLSGIAVIYDTLGATRLINILKKGYRLVRDFDLEISRMMGIVPSIRVTTCKPSGTISLLTGATPGVHFAIGGRYAKRRVHIANAVPLTSILKSVGIENEPTVSLPDSTCFTFYIDSGNVRGQQDVSLYEMLTLVATVQREWADNMVSTTISFDLVKEGPQLERAIANFAPVLKSCAFLPSSCDQYKQMPFETITKEEYEAGAAKEPKDIDHSLLLAQYSVDEGKKLEDPEAPKYCDGAACVFTPHH
jgi:ribonucleoside-diphosphate reductase alpha chain